MKTEEVRQKLIEHKKELLARVDRTHKHIYEKDKPVSPSFSEQSVEMESHGLILALDAEGREEICLIEKALQRLDEGEYELCTVCGLQIATERLEALPFTDKCIKCATGAEQ